jgi:ABC-type multidrug transport system fused ATPase/permease subunit
VFKVSKSNRTLSRVYQLLDPRQKKVIVFLIIAQLVLGIVDFVGVLIVGLMGSLAITVVSNIAINSRILQIISIMSIDQYSINQQIGILGFLVVVIFLIKTLLSIFLTKRIMMFMGNIATELSAKLITDTLQRPLLFLESETSQKRLFAITRGVDYLALFVLAPAVVFLADASILLVFALGLLIVQPVMTIISAAIFGILGYVIYKKLHTRSGYLGSISATFNIEISEKITEAFDLYREIVVRNGRHHYINEVTSMRQKLALSTAEFNLIPYIGKYVIEATVIFAAVILTMAQFMVNNAVSGITTLTVFLAASTRIAPAILRVQQGTIMIKGNLGMCLPTLELIDKLNETEKQSSAKNLEKSLDTDFSPTVFLKALDFRYGPSEKFAIKNLNLEIRSGEKIAIVGPSGSGKSTLIDLILGILKPDSGEILISGRAPIESFSFWPGETAYVPQKVGMIDGSILENLTFGLPAGALPKSQLESAIAKSALTEFIADHPQGLNAQVGESGSRLSAGQRQRLGIARALSTNPKLLILDEATSALDGITEEVISTSIRNLGRSTTVILIAHRLSTVQTADRVIYIEGGSIISQGTFQEVRKQVPDFDKQAKLMGL